MKTFFYSEVLKKSLWLSLSLTFLTISIQAQKDTCLLFDGGDQLSTFEPQDPNQQSRRIEVFNEIGAGDFTIEFNINSDGPGNQVEAVISNRTSSSGSNGFMVFFHPPTGGENYKRISIQLNSINFFMPTNGTFGGDIQDGTCHHIAAVRSGQTLTFYVDGIPIWSLNSPYVADDISSNRNTLIGFDEVDQTGFNGVISDMRIWNVARSAANINQFKDSYITGSETGLVANWRLDNLGSGLQDSSPNNNDIFKANDVITHPASITDCCSISQNVCIVNTINISTGVDHNDDQFYPIGQQVGFWTLVDIPPPSSAPTANISLPYSPYAINPHPAWGTFPGSSAWISAFDSNMLDENNPSPLPPYSYETYFCVSDDNSNVLFDFQALADDVVTVHLTDTQGTILHTFGQANFKQADVLDVNESINLDAGTYCIRGDGRNTNAVAMGFNLDGTISGASFIDYGCCNGDGSVITGQKIHDKNCDGEYSSDELAMGLAGWEIQLIDPSNGQVIETQITDDLGFYYFRNLSAGYYAISEVHQPNWRRTFPLNNYHQVELGTFEVQGGFHFGNKYEGPIETEPIGGSCFGQNTSVQIKWIGQECDCTIEVVAANCNGQGPELVLDVVNNIGTYNIPRGTLVGDYNFIIRDCDGNEIPVDGCVTFTDNEASIISKQIGCGEYEFSFVADGFDVIDVRSINWNFGIEGNATNPIETISFETADTYNIHLSLTLSNGCVINESIQLDVAQGANDPDCNFCPPNVLSEIEKGDLYIYDECYGMIIKSPNGSCFRVQVNDEGLLYAQGIECP